MRRAHLVASLFVLTACSAAPLTAPHPEPSPSSPEACQRAKALRERARADLAVGAVDRAARAIDQADASCSATKGETASERAKIDADVAATDPANAITAGQAAAAKGDAVTARRSFELALRSLEAKSKQPASVEAMILGGEVSLSPDGALLAAETTLFPSGNKRVVVLPTAGGAPKMFDLEGEVGGLALVGAHLLAAWRKDGGGVLIDVSTGAMTPVPMLTGIAPAPAGEVALVARDHVEVRAIDSGALLWSAPVDTGEAAVRVGKKLVVIERATSSSLSTIVSRATKAHWNAQGLVVVDDARGAFAWQDGHEVSIQDERAPEPRTFRIEADLAPRAKHGKSRTKKPPRQRPPLEGALAISPDGKTIAFANVPEHASLFDVATGARRDLAPKAKPKNAYRVSRLAFDATGERLCAQIEGVGDTCLFEVASGKSVFDDEAKKTLELATMDDAVVRSFRVPASAVETKDFAPISRFDVAASPSGQQLAFVTVQRAEESVVAAKLVVTDAHGAPITRVDLPLVREAWLSDFDLRWVDEKHAVFAWKTGGLAQYIAIDLAARTTHPIGTGELIVAGNLGVLGTPPQLVHLDRGEVLAPFGVSPSRSVALASRSANVAFLREQVVEVWDTVKGVFRGDKPLDEEARSFVLSDDGAELAALSPTDTRVWDVASSRLLIDAPERNVAAFWSAHRALVTDGSEGFVVAPFVAPAKDFSVRIGGIESLLFATEDRFVAVRRDDTTIIDNKGVQACEFDGQALDASDVVLTAVAIRDPSTCAVKKLLATVGKSFAYGRLDRAGSLAVMASKSTVCTYDVASGKQLACVDLPDASLSGVSVDAGLITALDERGLALVLDASTLAPRSTFLPLAPGVAASFKPEGVTVYGGASESAVRERLVCRVGEGVYPIQVCTSRVELPSSSK